MKPLVSPHSAGISLVRVEPTTDRRHFASGVVLNRDYPDYRYSEMADEGVLLDGKAAFTKAKGNAMLMFAPIALHLYRLVHADPFA